MAADVPSFGDADDSRSHDDGRRSNHVRNANGWAYQAGIRRFNHDATKLAADALIAEVTAQLPP